MTIGLLQIEFLLPEPVSLKQKRSIVKRIKNRCTKKYNIAVAELDNLDNYERGLIGFTTLSKDSTQPHKVLNNVESFIDDNFNLMVIDRKIETF